MTRETTERLRAANPSPVDDDRGHGAEAQAVLTRILSTERAAVTAPRTARRPSRRLLLVALAALLLAAGAAVAATDPFGFWRSSSPGTAMFGIDPSRHVRTPSAQRISCPHVVTGVFQCAAGLAGRRYEFIDRVQNVNPGPYTRGSLRRALDHALAASEVSRPVAQRLERDLAAVPDSFFVHFTYLMRFSTLSTSVGSQGNRELVPPRGVPAIIVCEPFAAELRCRDLNGDTTAAIGSGIYTALPGRDWVPAPAQTTGATSERLIETVFGRPLTPAEQRLMNDLVLGAHAEPSSSSSSSGARPRR